MRVAVSLGGLGLSVALLLSAAVASASDDEEQYGQPGYSVVYSRRPMTLAEHGLEIGGSMDVTRLVKDTSMLARDLETRLTIDVGAGFGITRNLEVRASLATLQIKPDVSYGNPTVSSTYRLLNSGLEIGVRLAATVVTKPDTILQIDKVGGILEPSVPFLFHLGKSARIDFGAGLPVTIQKGKATMVGLDAPVSLAFNLVDALHLGFRSSVYLSNFKDASRYLTIPLNLFAGISIGSEQPFLEIDPFFSWPKFATPGATDGTAKKINIDIYTAGLAIRGFIYL